MAFLRSVNIPLLIAHCSEARFSSSPIQTSARLRRFRVHGLIDALTTPLVQHISNPLGLKPLLHHKARCPEEGFLHAPNLNPNLNPKSKQFLPLSLSLCYIHEFCLLIDEIDEKLCQFP